MSTRFCWLIVTATALLSGVAAASVVVDYDRRVNFASYRTYSWGPIETLDPIWEPRVKEAVDGQLAARGWTTVPDNGDAIISVLLVTRPEQTLQGTFSGTGPWGFGGFDGLGHATITPQRYDVGTLVVQVADTATGNPVWRAIATDTVSSSPDKNIKRLGSEVRKMFKDFPPGAKRH